MEQKKNGPHPPPGLLAATAAMPVLQRFLDAYGKDMEFCQLQLNYIDWTFQDAQGEGGAAEPSTASPCG